MFSKVKKYFAHNYEQSAHSGLSKMRTFINPQLQPGAHTGTLYSDLGNITVLRKC